MYLYLYIYAHVDIDAMVQAPHSPIQCFVLFHTVIEVETLEIISTSLGLCKTGFNIARQ